MSRRFDQVDILALWIHGIVVEGHHILARPRRAGREASAWARARLK